MFIPVPQLDRYRSDMFEPASFRESGATVPFTTPRLFNARIRTAASGRGLEMLVANPSGGRSVQILPWSAMPEICSPTLFDRELADSLASSQDISPVGIRHQALSLAALGLAGRQAALNARDAQRRDQSSERMMLSMLLESLIAATENPSESADYPYVEDGAGLMRRRERALTRAAALAGAARADFNAEIEKLAKTLSGAIPDMPSNDARIRSMLAELREFANEIAEWAEHQRPEAAQAKAANFIAASARQAVECCEVALANTDALIADLGLVVAKWSFEKESIFERARGPDWVLDGWKTPIALWRMADPKLRSSAIREMALIAPILPREAKLWLGASSDWADTPLRITQVVREKADRRSGSLMELVARNEGLIGSSMVIENRLSPLIVKPKKVIVARMKTGGQGQGPSHDPKDKPAVIGLKSPDGKIMGASSAAKINQLSEARTLGAMIETTSDQALNKIVRLVDRLGNPEIHARLLGPSLRRLKRLRPPRPASLMRLLFMPLAGALVDPMHWRRTEGRIPRSTLVPLFEALSPILGSQLDVASAQLRGANLEDEALVERIGRRLWEAASLAVPRLHHDASWTQLGFGPFDFRNMTALAGALWRHAGPLWEGLQQLAGDCQPETLTAALIGPANEGNLVFAAAMNTLLQRAAHPSNFICLLQDLPIVVSPVVEDILNKWVSATLPELVEEDFATGAFLALEISLVVLALEELPRITARTDLKELISHRRNLDQFCSTTYREVVSAHVIQGLLELPTEDSDGFDEIERMARIARGLEDAGRRFGSAKPYEDLQDEFRTQMEKRLKGTAVSDVVVMEVARIKDILIGPEAEKRFIFRPRNQRMRQSS
jgi:hypothetical protein